MRCRSLFKKNRFVSSLPKNLSRNTFKMIHNGGTFTPSNKIVWCSPVDFRLAELASVVIERFVGDILPHHVRNLDCSQKLFRPVRARVGVSLQRCAKSQVFGESAENAPWSVNLDEVNALLVAVTGVLKFVDKKGKKIKIFWKLNELH